MYLEAPLVFGIIKQCFKMDAWMDRWMDRSIDFPVDIV